MHVAWGCVVCQVWHMLSLPGANQTSDILYQQNMVVVDPEWYICICTLLKDVLFVRYGICYHCMEPTKHQTFCINKIWSLLTLNHISASVHSITRFSVLGLCTDVWSIINWHSFCEWLFLSLILCSSVMEVMNSEWCYWKEDMIMCFKVATLWYIGWNLSNSKNVSLTTVGLSWSYNIHCWLKVGADMEFHIIWRNKIFSNFGGKNENFLLPILDFGGVIWSILAFSMHRKSTQIRLKAKLKGYGVVRYSTTHS